jgi:hypothetical protein
MQYGFLVTSTARNGSQKAMGMPILGIGVPHLQKTLLVLGPGVVVSWAGSDTLNPAIYKGNNVRQATCVTGLIIRPLHFGFASITSGLINNNIKNNTIVFIYCFSL